MATVTILTSGRLEDPALSKLSTRQIKRMTRLNYDGKKHAPVYFGVVISISMAGQPQYLCTVIILRWKLNAMKNGLRLR